jgi:hypothetical protein
VCNLQPMRHLYPLDLVTQTGHISKIHELLDGMSNVILSFLNKRKELDLRLSANRSLQTQHDHDSNEEVLDDTDNPNAGVTEGAASGTNAPGRTVPNEDAPNVTPAVSDAPNFSDTRGHDSNVALAETEIPKVSAPSTYDHNVAAGGEDTGNVDSSQSKKTPPEGNPPGIASHPPNPSKKAECSSDDDSVGEIRKKKSSTKKTTIQSDDDSSVGPNCPTNDGSSPGGKNPNVAHFKFDWAHEGMLGEDSDDDNDGDKKPAAVPPKRKPLATIPTFPNRKYASLNVALHFLTDTHFFTLYIHKCLTMTLFLAMFLSTFPLPLRSKFDGLETCSPF